MNNIPARSGILTKPSDVKAAEKITYMQIQSTVNCDVKSKGAIKFSENLLINLMVMQKRISVNEKKFWC